MWKETAPKDRVISQRRSFLHKKYLLSYGFWGRESVRNTSKIL